MVGTHTDSPVLRLKPVSKKQGEGFLQVGVEAYGGGIWHTWFDRDLSVAGRVMVKEGDMIKQKLVKVERPILRIPTLAIHLERTQEFKFNTETQLLPIAGLVAAELNRTGQVKEEKDTKEESDEVTPLKAPLERHHTYLVEIVAKEAGCNAEDIVDFELVCYDTQKSQLIGLNNELISSPRLDNLTSTYCGTAALVKSLESDSALDNDATIRVLACFDHEEIGSLSAQGADSNLLPSLIKRLSLVIPTDSAESDKSYDKLDDNSTAYEQTLIKSFLVSADVSHSVNPNYAGKYEADHKPEMNKGVVLKINANARYATNAPGIVLVQECAKRSKAANVPGVKAKSQGVPLQQFVVRNDSPCGGTIGPMLSAKLGVRCLGMFSQPLAL
jgi:aspartyl aminopeptidase